MKKKACSAYHRREAQRIRNELDQLDPNLFAADGVVRSVLAWRVKQEVTRSKAGPRVCCCGTAAKP